MLSVGSLKATSLQVFKFIFGRFALCNAGLSVGFLGGSTAGMLAGFSTGVLTGVPTGFSTGVSAGALGGRPRLAWVTRLRFTFNDLSKGTLAPPRQEVAGSGALGETSTFVVSTRGVLRGVRKVPLATSTAFFCSGVRAFHSL